MATKQKQVSKNDRIDLDMVMGLVGNALLSDQGVQQITGLMQQAKDPSGVLAQIVFHAIGQVKDQLESKGMDISNKVWAARRGVIDQAIAEVAKVAASVSNDPSILNPRALEQTRNNVVQLLQDQEAHSEDNEYGPPNQSVNGFAEGSPDEEAAESPEEAMAEGDVGGMMPPGEAGGSHGPNRMPSPMGLLAGG